MFYSVPNIGTQCCGTEVQEPAACRYIPAYLAIDKCQCYNVVIHMKVVCVKQEIWLIQGLTFAFGVGQVLVHSKQLSKYKTELTQILMLKKRWMYT